MWLWGLVSPRIVLGQAAMWQELTLELLQQAPQREHH
jgi:hypothetical protein